MSRRPWLHALAARLGIEEGYLSAIDERWVATSDGTREALAAAMGQDGSSEASARRALAALGPAAPGPAPRASAEEAERCLGFEERVGAAGAFGLVVNLYSVRSSANRGFGHLGDLAQLVERASAEGAAFVGTSPLHAGTNRPGRFCPYFPVSRLFREPLYLDLERVPELASCDGARRALDAAPLQGRVEALRQAERLDPGAVEAALRPALRELYAHHRSAKGEAADQRRAAFDAWRSEQGPALEDFATFQALAERFEVEAGERDWRSWPAAFRKPDGAAVGSFRGERADEIGFHAWLQFELDRQLGLVQRAARRRGMAIGLYADLALGSAPGGSDTWTWPALFAGGASVGAPPDGFSPSGQDWGFPPLVLHGTGADALGFWGRLLEANLRHVGALRIDHALGLRRLFWIPAGRPPSEGAYVRQPEAQLLDAIAAASRRHGALIVGEDLGTVPLGFSASIQARGLLSSRVLLFERDADGAFLPASAYPRACLATANTHDLPPLAALAGDADLVLRRRAGHIPDDASLARAREERVRERTALRARLVADGALDPADPDPDLCAAVTRFLCGSSAVLVGLSLDDLAGETEPINLPGVPSSRHLSWTRRMGMPLEALFGSPLARRSLAAVPRWRRHPRPSAGRPPTAKLPA